jgi:hypothetical protein
MPTEQGMMRAPNTCQRKTPEHFARGFCLISKVIDQTAAAYSGRTNRDVPEPQAVNVDPARADAVRIPSAMPKVAITAGPIVAIVCSADDVVSVYGSIDVNIPVHIDVSVDVNVPVHVDVSVDVNIPVHINVAMNRFSES